ncbi:MAG TPA: ABC-F family ATP-binding cassette domain-containing protein [Candidatus Eisenbacteria bacterium]|nr:ABC-F family ATP-binding cassette domain-containing protein [Candidatus Eisenbacteria bacterium]
MIRLNDVVYSIGTRVLLDRLTWTLGPGDRVALVGPNGAGKTTLLRILLGEIRPDEGTRVMSKGTRIGYLPQEAAEKFDGTVLDRALEAHRHVIEKREELDALYERIPTLGADHPELEALLDRAGELQHALERADEHALEPEARRVLAGLGFSPEDQDRPLASFSGGWRMRAALASLLLTDPTLLFLDEPTNHLDLPAMEWLEEYLETFHGGLVVVSHDRVFLDRIADEIRELDRGELNEYPMSFTEYLEERERRREAVEAKNVQLEQKIAQLNRFVERFGAKNTKATQAASKMKQIDRLKRQRVVLPRRARHINFAFPSPPHVGRTLVRLEDASFGYEKRDVFTDANVIIERGDKIAIVGANGAGKTTLLRLLAGQLQARRGLCEVHPQARLAYFAQHAAETLDGSLNVLQAVEDVAPFDTPTSALRSLLGNFLFVGDDVFKSCRVLSGGERQRVALARMLLQPANLLLLDEPTHHLDLAGKEVLEGALQQYPGAVIVVTHDRSLMASLATRIVAVEAGRVLLYPGGYDDYESARIAKAEAAKRGGTPGGAAEARAAAAAAVPGAKAAGAAGATAPGRAAGPGSPKTSKAKKPGTNSRDPALKSEAKRMAREREKVERDLETREGELKEVESSLADPAVYADGVRTKELLARYEGLRKDVDGLWRRLEELDRVS